MRFEFRKLGVDIEDSFYRGKDAGDFAWVTVRVTLADRDADTFGEIKIPIAMFLKGGQTLDELRRDAMTAAVEMMNTAVSALQANTYDQLVAAHVEMDRSGD
jgi:hypothetical protein